MDIAAGQDEFRRAHEERMGEYLLPTVGRHGSMQVLGVPSIFTLNTRNGEQLGPFLEIYIPFLISEIGRTKNGMPL